MAPALRRRLAPRPERQVAVSRRVTQRESVNAADDDKRCVIVSPFSEQRGGAELSLMHLLTGGDINGVRWSVALPADGGIASTARSAGCDVEVLGETRARQPIRMTQAVWRLRRLIRRQKADLVLAWMPHSHWWGLPAALSCGVPAAWFQKDRVQPGRLSTRLTNRLPCRGILANSLYTARNQRPLSQTHPILVVPSGFEIDRFDPSRIGTVAECRQQLGLGDGPLIGSVGRLQSWKGHHVLIEALAKVRSSVPDARLIIVGGAHPGEADYEQALHRQVKEAGLDESVIFTGAVPHATVPAYMQACDVLAHAGEGEPFGIVVAEAMALGKPLVAADSGGPATTVTEGVDGLLAPPTDATKYAEQLLRLLGPEGQQLGKAARTNAMTYSVDVFRQRAAQAVAALVNGLEPGIYLDGAKVE